MSYAKAIAKGWGGLKRILATNVRANWLMPALAVALCAGPAEAVRFAIVDPAAGGPFEFPLDLQECKGNCYVIQDYGDFGSNLKRPEDYHTGIDIAAPVGTKVYPIAPGKVVLTQEAGQKAVDKLGSLECKYRKSGSNCKDHGYGNTIIIFHKKHGIYSQYSHLDEILVTLGSDIGPNDIVGRTGCSGYEYKGSANDPIKTVCAPGVGKHLHLELKNFDTLRKEKIHEGTAQDGGPEFITLDSSASDTDDFYNGATIRIVAGTGITKKEIVVFDYVGSKRVADVRPKWDTVPDDTSVFVIEERAENCGWGYAKKLPVDCGYHDPITFREMVPRGNNIVVPPLTVKLTLEGTKEPGTAVRWLPLRGMDEDRKDDNGLDWSDITLIERVKTYREFRATRTRETKTFGNTIKPACSEGWYQIEHTDSTPFTHERWRRREDGTKKLVEHKRAWICRGNDEEIWVKEEKTRPKPRQRVGLATALVIDRSGSMKGDKLRKAKAGAAAYVKLLEPSDFASVSSFSKGARTDMSMSSQADARKNIETVLGTIDPVSATNIAAGLERGHLELGGVGANARKVALLLSDGRHNVGSFESTVEPMVRKFAGRRPAWPIYTIGYGNDADPKTLRDRISEPTGGRYWHADTVDVEDVYCQINADIYNKSNILSVSDALPPGGEITQVAYVAPGARNLTVCTSWQGSKLLTVLVSPNGRTLGKEHLTNRIGRYDEGETYQLLRVYKPQPGRWQIKARWEDPPPIAEQVNITVSEKSDILGQILGLKSEYNPGEPVRINVEVAEVVGYERVPLLDARVRVQVQKPGGTKMVRLVRTRPINRRLAKRTIRSATRNVRLYDDGAHNDYRAGDGIFGGTFTETDENGAYLVTATVTGHKRSGQRVQRRLIASFQVGPISRNPVTTAQVLEYRDLLEGRTDPAEAIERLRSDPLDAIKSLQSGPSEDTKHLPQRVN